MSNTVSTSSIVLRFLTVEEHLRNYKLDRALAETRHILSSNPENNYALAMERRLSRLMLRWDHTKKMFEVHNVSLERTIGSLQHFCQMARKMLIQQQKNELKQVDE